MFPTRSLPPITCQDEDRRGAIHDEETTRGDAHAHQGTIFCVTMDDAGAIATTIQMMVNWNAPTLDFPSRLLLRFQDRAAGGAPTWCGLRTRVERALSSSDSSTYAPCSALTRLSR